MNRILRYVLAVVALVSTPALADGVFTFSNLTISDGVTVQVCETVTIDMRGCTTISAGAPPPQLTLANVSIRGRVGVGDDVVILGFVITAQQAVVIVGRGPSLESAGVVGALQDPMLTVVNQATGAVIDKNDNWAEPERWEGIYSTGHAPPDAREAATLLVLQPGAYTAILSGAHGGQGVGIVELYGR